MGQFQAVKRTTYDAQERHINVGTNEPFQVSALKAFIQFVIWGHVKSRPEDRPSQGKWGHVSLLFAILNVSTLFHKYHIVILYASFTYFIWQYYNTIGV